MKQEIEERSKLTLGLIDSARFEILPDGWIRDHFTGLEFGPSSEKIMNFENAQEYCKEQGGRLPEVHELHSLVDFSKRQPATFAAFKDTKYDNWYWTTTPVVGWKGERWCVSFDYGFVFNYDGLSDNYVRPCRAGQ